MSSTKPTDKINSFGGGVEDNDGVDADVDDEKPHPLPLLPPWAPQKL